ncbi:ABC transporter substrate-binding protein [Oceaniglobus trochenteri]|uniref:ABC transporter substrate-binding protein n=1 Tax=Oceaniglobus trochenteri TaxID=2763260 RepID=UPI001CFFAB41|nr:ABC transporter substrate-binding protein [Oceaniglobus trochenteri]
MRFTSKATIGAAVVSCMLASSVSAETLRWGSPRDIYSLDPYSYGSTSNLAFLNHIYDGLVRYTPDFDIVPALATDWELIDDGKAWRFNLRKGVTFHNGAEFTADDVVASMKRVSDPKSPLRGNIPLYADVTKVDDYTVDIAVTSPSALFLNDMTNIFMFDADWLKDNGAEEPTDVGAKVEGFATHNTNGTGAFELVSRVPDSKTVLKVNDNWWDEKKHNLDMIEFMPISSPSTRVAALLSGEIDLTDGAPLQDVARLEAQPNITVVQRAELRTVLIGMNRRDTLKDGRDNFFNDLRVRQAIDMSIDRELIQKRVMRDMSRAAGTLIAPEIPGYTEELDKLTEVNVEKAKALLEEAGATGAEFTLLCMTDESVNEEDVCSALISMFTRIGLKPTLDIGPRAIQAPKRNNGEADMFLMGWANEPTLDAYSILSQVLSTREGAAGVSNRGGWSYPELDEMVKKAALELDREKRLAIETGAMQFAKDELIMLPLHQQPMAWAMTDKVEDVAIGADNKPRHWLTRLAD